MRKTYLQKADELVQTLDLAQRKANDLTYSPQYQADRERSEADPKALLVKLAMLVEQARDLRRNLLKEGHQWSED